jgi:microcystin-dependent protein
MSQPFVGEIRMVGFNFAPVGWAVCDGETVPISENETLYNLIGTTYGGDGQSTFQLPNLLGRIPVGQGTGGSGTYIIGELAGTETVTLTVPEIPSHTHALRAQTAAGTQPSPSGGVWANSSLEQYSTGAPTAQMAATSLQNAGGNLPHDNMPPFLAINFIIALYGIYPSQG